MNTRPWRFFANAAWVLPAAALGLPALGAPYGAGFYDTSSYMMGKIYVKVILVESDGTLDPKTTNPWTEAMKQNALTQIALGAQWWSNREPRANLEWIIDLQTVSTKYEPINRYFNDHKLWINDVMERLGYASTTGTDHVFRYCNDLREANGTDWAYVVFVVNDSNDNNGYFPDKSYYALLGGPYTVLGYGSTSLLGPEYLQMYFAHETGHIFYALDEYYQTQDWKDMRSGYLNIQNLNSGAAHSTCIMAGNQDPYEAGNVCSYTREMLGWRDSDGDGVFDILDVAPETVLQPYPSNLTADNTPSYQGRATVGTYPNTNPAGKGNGISTNKIAGAVYKLDSGEWMDAAASPADGGFDQGSEAFAFTLPPLSNGAHTIYAAAKDNRSNLGTSNPASDSLTVDASLPSDPVDTTPPSAVATVFDGLAEDLAAVGSLSELSAHWTASSDAESDIARYWYAIGTTPRGTDVAGWTESGWTGPSLNTSVVRTGLSLTQGRTYYFTVKAENAAGLQSSPTSSNGQVADTTPPVESAWVNDGLGADIAWTASASDLSANWAPASDPESGIRKYWYRVMSRPAGSLVEVVPWTDNGPNTSVTKTGLSLVDGMSYEFWIKPENGVGLQLDYYSLGSAWSNGQRVDFTPPVLSLQAPAEGSYGCCEITYQGSASDSGSGLKQVELYVDAEAAARTALSASFSYRWNFSTTPDGRHTVRIVATDQVGNASEKRVPVVVNVNGAGSSAAIVDLAPPSVSITSPADGSMTGAKILITGTASDATSGLESINLYLDSEDASPLATLNSSPFSYEWDSKSLASGTPHRLIAKAVDRAGNSSEHSVAVTVDNAGPVIGSIYHWGVSTGAITISWTTDEPSDSEVQFGYTTSYGNTVAQGEFSKSHSVKLQGLVPGANYHYRVRSSDALGNRSTSTDRAFSAWPLEASFDASLKAPKCDAQAAVCYSGTLLNGRAHITGGSEPNQPNTLFSSCADGTSGTYHADESIDMISVTSSEGPLTSGKSAKVCATVWAYSVYKNDYLDLFYAKDANNPSWTYLATLKPAKGASQLLCYSYALPSSSLQAVRAQFRYYGSNTPCSAGELNDRDDIVFAVASGLSLKAGALADQDAAQPADHVPEVLPAPLTSRQSAAAEAAGLVLLGRVSQPEPQDASSGLDAALAQGQAEASAETDESRPPRLLTQAMAISILYEENDLPQGVRESDLKLYLWNEDLSSWEEVRGAARDNQANEFNLTTSLVGDFRIFLPASSLDQAASDLSGLKVYPNPWVAGSGPQSAPSVAFEGLTQAATLKIYDLAGCEKVRLSKSDSGGRLDWNGRDGSGGKVPSGVYFYTVTSGQGERKKGRLAVVR